MTETSKTLQKRISWGLLAGLMIYVVLRSVAAAAGKPLWYDELLTLAVSSLGSWKARMAALMLPLDGQPPLFYVIERFASGLTQHLEIALRVPSIAALVCTLICIFVYARRRGGEVVGLLCAAMILTTTVFQTYAVEARPYSMVAACIAFALVCYQRAPAAMWMVLLGVSLAVAESLHYLAVLALVPLGLAEAAVLWKTWRVRWLVWAAFVLGIVPLGLQWKLLAINKAYYGPHFWARFSFTNLPQTYGEFFSANSAIGGGIAGLVLATMVVAFFWQSAAEKEKQREAATTAEVVLLTAFVLLPCIAYVLVNLMMHSGLTMRYVLLTVLGIALAMGFALSRATWRATAVFAVVLIGVIGVQELSFWRSIRGRIQETRSNTANTERFLTEGGHQELAVAVPNYAVYMPLVYSGDRNFTRRLVFLYQEPTGVNEHLPDTVNKGMILLRSFWPIQMSNFQEFTSVHNEFLVYIEDRDPGRDWFTWQLFREGWLLRPIGYDSYRILYLANRGRSSSP